MDKLSTLQRFDFYREAPAALQAKIAAAAEFVRLAAGAYYYREGDVCRQLAVVGRGSLRVFKIGETGREITLYHVQDGQSSLVNMLSVLLEQPAVATAQVEVATEAVVIPAPAVREWARTSGPLRRYTIEVMAERLMGVMTLVEEIVFARMDSRLATLLIHRFGTGRTIAATHEELAAELGTVREVVSRLLKEFERTGGIHLSRGRLELRDEAVLHRLVQGAHAVERGEAEGRGNQAPGS